MSHRIASFLLALLPMAVACGTPEVVVDPRNCSQLQFFDLVKKQGNTVNPRYLEWDAEALPGGAIDRAQLEVREGPLLERMKQQIMYLDIFKFIYPTVARDFAMVIPTTHRFAGNMQGARGYSAGIWVLVVRYRRYDQPQPEVEAGLTELEALFRKSLERAQTN